MNFKIMVFGAEWSPAAALVSEELRCIFSGFLQEGKEVAFYGDLTEAGSEFAARFRGTDVVFLLSALPQYAKTKKLLSRAMHLELQSVPDAAKLACRTLGDLQTGSEEMFAHCMAPVGQPAFYMGDGLYTGFCVRAGKQLLFLLPFEKDRTVALLHEYVIPYINEFFGIGIPTDSLLRYRAQQLNTVLAEKNCQIAVSGTKPSVLIRSSAEQQDGMIERLRFTPSAEARGNLHPVEYAANLSVAACELEGTPYGAAMTNAYYTDEEDESDDKCVYIAFTDEEDTAVREIHSLPGESLESFLLRSTENFFSFAAEKISAVAQPADQEVETQSFLTRGKIAMLAAVAALAAVLSILMSYFITEHMLEEKSTQAAQQAASQSSVIDTDVLQYEI